MMQRNLQIVLARLRRGLLLGGLLLGGLVLSGMATTLAQAGNPPWLPEARAQARSAIEQFGVAIREAVFAQTAPDIQELKLRAARVLNVIVGRASPQYQSQAGDPPGADGEGILTHLQRLQEVLEPQARGNERLRPLLFALQQVQAFSEDARGRLLEMSRLQDLRAVRRTMRLALALLLAARGSQEDPLSEGGTRALLKALESP